ncbi:MAG: FG-GAP repeat protein [Planctomycetes bacterium]|nr:FG-GAP repeat protein [Planctomycetota bacterium]
MDARGFVTTPKDNGWTWGLEIVGYGWGESQKLDSTPRAISVDGSHFARAWDTRLTEWYVNDRRGLEHGFTISERPKHPILPLTIDLAVRGGLRPSISPDGRNISFISPEGGTAVHYNGLVVRDAAGHSVAAQWQGTQDKLLRLIVEDTNVQYPIIIDPIAQQAYLKASNTGASDGFGWSVAISGNSVVVGVPGEDSNATGIDGNQADNSSPSSGAAYVFVRSGSSWTQQAYLKASNSGANDQFGWAVAISGDSIVVGAQSEDSNATGVNGNGADNSAFDSGATYVFVRSGSTWTQQAYLKASNTNASDQFGFFVSISGDSVVVGAPGEDSNATGVNGNQSDNTSTNSGAAYVFARSGSTWIQQAYLKASNTGGGDNFGLNVGISGDTVIVGAYREDSSSTGVNGNQADNSATDSGASYIFARSGSTWTQQAYLKASNTNAVDQFGFSVAISGETVVVGAIGEASNATGVNGNQADNSVLSSGAAYVFVRSGSTWAQQAYLKASNANANDQFGFCVAISGDSVVVGAPSEDSNATGINGNGADNSTGNSGAAYVLVRNGFTWGQQAYLKASNTGASDEFGRSAAISGDVLMIGAWGEDSNATGVNGNQADNAASGSGAAYVFDLDVNPGITVFGTGTPGCAGVHTLDVTHAPMIHSPHLSITCDNAPPSSLGLGIITNVPDVLGSDPFFIGVLLHADFFASTEIYSLDFLSDASGSALAAAPIPNAPALVGDTYYAMALWAWTTCPLPPYNLSTSKGLAITVLMP